MCTCVQEYQFEKFNCVALKFKCEQVYICVLLCRYEGEVVAYEGEQVWSSVGDTYTKVFNYIRVQFCRCLSLCMCWSFRLIQVCWRRGFSWSSIPLMYISPNVKTWKCSGVSFFKCTELHMCRLDENKEKQYLKCTAWSGVLNTTYTYIIVDEGYEMDKKDFDRRR